MPKIRVWDKNASLVGTFEVLEPQPQYVLFGTKLYAFLHRFNVYQETVYTVVGMMETTDVNKKET